MSRYPRKSIGLFEILIGLVFCGWLAFNYPQVFGVLCIVALAIFLFLRWKNPTGYIAHGKETASYSGKRMRRGTFLLWSVGVGVLCGIPGALAQKDPSPEGQMIGQLFSLGLYGLCSIGFNRKRLHDLGKSGWLTLLQFIPGVGFLLWLYLACTRGNVGSNSYGLDPRGEVRAVI